MKPIPLKPAAKSATQRRFTYLCLAVVMGSVGATIAYSSYQEYQKTQGPEWGLAIVIGILFPFIFVIGEMIKLRKYFSKIDAVLCVDCRHEFDIDQLVKTGKCPQCQSRRIVGLEPDDDDPIISLY